MSLYFVAVEPQTELITKIREIQEDFALRFFSKKAANNFPHITLIPPFSHDEENEGEVIGHFQKTEINSDPFYVGLQRFGSFSHSKNPVIYIKPQLSSELLQLHESFEKSMQRFSFVRNFNPHITVAYRDLTVENFQKAWTEYQHKDFCGEFLISTVGLYKHSARKWQLLSSRAIKKC